MDSKGKETSLEFENRKRDHIRWALDPQNEASENYDLDEIELIHEALPELDFSEVSLETTSLNISRVNPFLLSSMTAGHKDSLHLNLLFAQACEARGWLMGVGSQRRELNDPEASREWKEIRQRCPKVQFLGNIGLSQLIRTPIEQIEKLSHEMQAIGMIVHLNALQECLQPEGTPEFRGGLEAIENLCRSFSVPVIVKETGCGFSELALRRLMEVGVAAVDVSGLGGTHWGRIEGCRSPESDVRHQAAQTFKNWGVTTRRSVLSAAELNPSYEIWASGGVRSGLDGAKLIAMGARMVGFAKPLLAAALSGGINELLKTMERFEFEMKVALFCTGSRNLNQLQERSVWQCRKT